MKVVDSLQMKLLDEKTIQEIGIPGMVLMERAGMAVFTASMKMIRDEHLEHVIVLCGPGNNGGDGYVVARHMSQAGVPVQVVSTHAPDDLKGDTFRQWQIAHNMGLPVWIWRNDSEKLKRCIYEKNTLIIDALFGTGMERPVKDEYALLISFINECPAPVISVDIPSGINAATGQVMNIAVMATETVTFQLPKIGNVSYPGAGFNGSLHIADIGIPKQMVDESEASAWWYEQNDISKLLPVFSTDAHKGTRGTLGVFGGKMGYTGAAVLASKAAHASGTGLVKLYCRKSLQPIYENWLAETITVDIPDPDTSLSVETIDETLSQLARIKALVAGPGWGDSDEWNTWLHALITQYQGHLLLDADALNIVSRNPQWIENRKNSLIITPHPGEMARLCNQSIETVNNNRIQTAVDMADKWNAVVVLKGAGTVIASPGKKVVINPTGNPGMAKGGSGDVLAGIIGSFLAQGMEPIDACVAGCWIHGRAGDIASAEKTSVSLSPTDLIHWLPSVYKELLQPEDKDR